MTSNYKGLYGIFYKMSMEVVKSEILNSQADFNGRCVVNEMDADVFHRLIVSLRTRRAAWRLSQDCDCVARELK